MKIKTTVIEIKYFFSEFRIVAFLFYFAVLRAMKEDSEKVPSLLTDYILKGEFCNGCGAVAGSSDRSGNASSC